MKTLQELRDERARLLTELDDIIATAKQSGEFPDAERARHDQLVASIEGADGLDAQIVRAVNADGDAARLEAAEARRARYLTVQTNPSTDANVRRGRSLDEMLWASDEAVRAGSYDKTGQFRQHASAMNPVEQTLVRSGNGDEVYAPRIGEFRPEDRQVVRSFQKLVADMQFFGLLVDKSAKSGAEGFQVARSHKLFRPRWQEMLRAMDTDTSAEGVEWIPTGIGSSIHEKVRAAGKVAPLFARINIPTNPWKWPLEAGDATAYRVAEPTSDTATKVSASTPGTGAATFDAEIFGARTLFSRSLEADSALAILPFVQRKLVLAFMNAEERAILDGDADGTHQDSDTNSAGSTDAAWAWDGLRKKALAQTSTATTTTSAANLASIRKAMTKWGVNPADLAFILGVQSYHVIMSDSNVLTVDKMGPNATILNGQIGSIYGVPIIVSEFVRENLNASGVYDGITTTKTYALCVNRNEWVMGQRMAMGLETDDSIYRETYQRVMVGFMREDFQSVADAATNEDTSIGYNITAGS
jgi:HK97 family phage major capsid protein